MKLSAGSRGSAIRQAIIAALVAGVAIQGARAKVIEPPDVYQNTLVIRAELEEIRKFMGRPIEGRPEINVHGAQPREVFFQAITLWVKANRLCREARGAGMAHLAKIEIAPPENVTPADVWTLTQNAMGRLICVKWELGLGGRAPIPPRDASKTPTDVFRSIVQANRQLNHLLTSPFSPGEVFAIVNLSNEYVAETLDRLVPGWRADAPPLPAYVEGKAPIDVFGRLTRCYAVVRQIAERSELAMLEFEADLDQPITPSDVFDLASLVFSEIRYLAAKIGVKKRYKFRPQTDKVPSDVYQQAQHLEALLAKFEASAHLISARQDTD